MESLWSYNNPEFVIECLSTNIMYVYIFLKKHTLYIHFLQKIISYLAMVANYFKHNLPSVLDVLIDDTSNSHGQEGVVPTAHKHDSNAKYDSKK